MLLVKLKIRSLEPLLVTLNYLINEQPRLLFSDYIFHPACNFSCNKQKKINPTRLLVGQYHPSRIFHPFRLFHPALLLDT